jgi:dihydroflavonol-4-reductase
VDEVFLTGATGFVGSHVLEALLQSGYHVRALVRPGSRPLPDRTHISTVMGDLARTGELTRAMDGCHYLVHVAAVYSFAPSRRHAIHRVNVQGTTGILEAARIAGIERAVVTSSSATVGPAANGRLPTEDDWAPEHSGVSTYHHSKLQQERAALAAQLPAVLVLPTTPVGPGDVKPTPTGKMIVDFMRGRMVASLPGGLNIVPVEDVGRAHVLALEQGRLGERYLVGGENLSLDELWRRLAAMCGRPAPTRQLPYGLALAAGWADEIRCRVRPTDEPIAPLEGVWMGHQKMYVCDDKARSELGYASRPATEALERAVHWFRDHGYA